MSKRTPLYDRHVGAGGQMVPFGGWDMPLHYGSQLEEHHQVRRHAGIFDVSHMTVVDMGGADATAWLRRLLANDVARLAVGQALYSCMLNEAGGVIDDLIVYRRPDAAPAPYRLVVNAATRDRDLAWMQAAAAGRDVALELRNDLVMLAVQGPRACELAAPLLPEALRPAALALQPFHAVESAAAFIGRTGYTGEDGWEVLLPVAAGLAFWDAALAAGIAPCGLGARDTLRLEAGMNLYGQDMDEEVSPWEANLGWTIALDAGRDFIGRNALEQQQAAGVGRVMIGLVMDDKGVLRHGQRVATPLGDGEILSGSFAPTLGKSIAFARVPVGAHAGLQVDIRGRLVPVRVVKYPFVRDGRSQLEA